MIISRFLLILFLLPIHWAYASDNTVRDLVEDVGVPAVPKRQPLKRDNKVHSLKNMVFTTDNDSQSISAITLYPLSKQKGNSPLVWDDLNKFGRELDQRFFKDISRKAIAGGVIAACFGAIVPHPSCGYVIDKTGNFLNIPISSLESNLFIAWIVVTTTPAFVQQSFNIGKGLISCIFHEDPFDTGAKDEDSKPHVFKKDRLHHLANVILLGSAAINASIPTILMREAEKEFPVFVAATFFPFYCAWAENYFMSGYLNIHHLFEFYRYTSKSNYQKREILKEKIWGLKKALQSSDKLVLNIYDTIHDQKKKGFPGDENTPFAFSALFLRSLSRMEGDEETGDVAEAFLMNFKLDVDTSSRALSDDLFSWASTFLTGAGIYTRYCITESVLDGLLLEFGISPETAMIASTSLAAFEASYRVLTSHYVQKEYFKTFKNVFQSRGNFPFLRKGAGVVSFVNGALFSLPNLVAGMRVFKDYSVVSKVAYLTPSFLLDLAYHDSFFSDHYNKFITNTSTVRSKNIGVTLKRAHLNYYLDKSINYMDQFDQETVEKLYAVLQKGL